MKTVLKLILVYIALQFLGTLAALPFVMAVQYAATGTLDANLVTQQSIVPGLALTLLFTVAYLWKAGYLTGDSRLYSPVSLGWTVVLGAGAILLLDGLTSALSFLPDWMEASFDYMQSSWAGILLVALAGPVVEELFFRGGVLRVLLRTCRRPWVAIVVSGLVFGLIHMNPAQVVFASFAGILLGWLYWRTRSLIPCMVVHVLNNSFSVWLTLRYPEADSLRQVMGGGSYTVCLAVAAVVFGVALWALLRRPAAGAERVWENNSTANTTDNNKAL